MRTISEGYLQTAVADVRQGLHRRFVLKRVDDLLDHEKIFWPDLVEEPYLRKFLKSLRKFNYNYALGFTSLEDYSPVEGEIAQAGSAAASGSVQLPTGSIHDIAPTSQAAGHSSNAGGLVHVNQETEVRMGYYSGSSQLERFLYRTLKSDSIEMNEIETRKLVELSPLRPMAFFVVTIAYTYPDWMLHYFLNAITSILADAKKTNITPESVLDYLGFGEAPSTVTFTANEYSKRIISKYVTSVNTLIKGVFPDKASGRWLKTDSDRNLEWAAVRKLVKLFVLTLAPQAR